MALPTDDAERLVVLFEQLGTAIVQRLAIDSARAKAAEDTLAQRQAEDAARDEQEARIIAAHNRMTEIYAQIIADIQAA